MMHVPTVFLASPLSKKPIVAYLEPLPKITSMILKVINMPNTPRLFFRYSGTGRAHLEFCT